MRFWRHLMEEEEMPRVWFYLGFLYSVVSALKICAWVIGGMA